MTMTRSCQKEKKTKQKKKKFELYQHDDDEVLPEGEKDQGLDREELCHGLHGRQFVPQALVKVHLHVKEKRTRKKKI